MGRWVAALGGVIAILLTACSTIVKGDATASLYRHAGRPGRRVHAVLTCRRQAHRAECPRASTTVAVNCVKQRYTTGFGTLASENEIMTAGNVIFGGVIGLGIDAASGAMNKYQPGVEIAMSPIPNCDAPRKVRGAPMASTPAPPQEAPS
jgi:hypothetical protein